MKTNILKNAFRNNNIQDIRDFFEKRNSVDSNQVTRGFDFYKPEPPGLIFFDKKNIKSGYYNFQIDEFCFRRCYIYALEQEAGSPFIKYHSGSYDVIRSEERVPTEPEFPEDIDTHIRNAGYSVLKKTFDFDKIFNFCQKHKVEIVLQSDCQYHCLIDYKEGDPSWGIDIDSFSAYVLGINKYIERHE